MARQALTRRVFSSGLGVALLQPFAVRAQAPGPAGPPPTAEEIAAALPLKTTGLEHIAMIVPDVGAAGRFYSKVFNPDRLHKEQEGELRYYVELAPGYIAIGGRASPPPPFLDHFCALVEDYRPAAIAARLREEGLPQGRFGIFPDPNGIGLQLLGVPAGLATSTEPSTRIVNGDALVAPMGLEHVLLLVDDVEQSAAFYGKFFDGAQTRDGEPERVWIDVAGTRLGLQARPPLEPPRVDEFAVRVAPFERDALTTELRLIGATVAPDDGSGLLRFRDPYGLGVALKPV
jgi:catechol 2,3-dioxygenase-like lactoylglutathione lyase family enzyme